ncbi:hypothetical protein BJ138DRAFT_1106322 [Hygrophoropsis aurantiaca]|uniref:Uncharacterized protein n=1 Tax=Hygrophoropsis aurantiaca TaxID=72124 RepID=A0ACB7ZWI8_9AGAM|nr:hypothetical protein BJ138DRAFT_1106322 [Hygrophoropsis aurantiaca]
MATSASPELEGLVVLKTGFGNGDECFRFLIYSSKVETEQLKLGVLGLIASDGDGDLERGVMESGKASQVGCRPELSEIIEIELPLPRILLNKESSISTRAVFDMGYFPEEHDEVNAAIASMQDEVQELEIQERDLAARLRLVQNSLAVKRAAIARLKNSVTSVHLLPDEILLLCFHIVIQLWQDEIERSNENSILYEDEIHYSPCTPAVAISHVSRHWRQLAINAPLLWTRTNSISLKEDRADVHLDILKRIGNLPFSLTFQQKDVDNDDDENIVINALASRAHQISAIFSVNANDVVQLLFRKMGFSIMDASLPTSLDHLTTLSIVQVGSPQGQPLDYGLWQRFLSSTPRLKTLQISSDAIYRRHSGTQLTEISLPELQNLTTLNWGSGLRQLVTSLSVPDLQQLKLLDFCLRDAPILLINNRPRFPKVRDLTLKFPGSDSDTARQVFIDAFPSVTHFRGHPALFELPRNYSCWPDLQQFTLDFVRGDIVSGDDLDIVYTFLQARANQAKYPLRICIAEHEQDIYSYDDLTNLGVYGEVEGALYTCDDKWKAPCKAGQRTLAERRRLYLSWS